MTINRKHIKDLEDIKSKIKKQKIGTVEEIDEYNLLFKEYKKISKKVFGR